MLKRLSKVFSDPRETQSYKISQILQLYARARNKNAYSVANTAVAYLLFLALQGYRPLCIEIARGVQGAEDLVFVKYGEHKAVLPSRFLNKKSLDACWENVRDVTERSAVFRRTGFRASASAGVVQTLNTELSALINNPAEMCKAKDLLA